MMIPEHFYQIVKNLPDPLCLVYGSGEVIVVNNALCNLLECKSGDLLGKSIHELLDDPPSKVNGYLDIWKRSGEFMPGTFDLRAVNSKISQFRIEGMLLQPKTNNDTELLMLRLQNKQVSTSGFVALNEKIAQLNRELGERNQINKALRTLASGMSSIDNDKFFQDCVKSLAELFDTRFAFIAILTNSERRDVRTITMLEGNKFLPNFEYNLYGTPCEDIFNETKELIPTQAQQLYPDGKLLKKLNIDGYLGTAMVSSAQQKLGLVAVMDVKPIKITDWSSTVLHVYASRIALELEQLNANKELQGYHDKLEGLVTERTAALELANRELESYSYSIAHDLRTPLRAITSFSQLLVQDAEDKLNDEERDYVRRITSSAKYMSQIIDDILDLARITRSEVHKESLDLSALVSDVASELSFEYTTRKVKFKIEQGLCVKGDPNLLKLMTANLLGNALKFTSKNQETEISFGAVEENGKSTYYVNDNGAGFEEKYAKNLFQPFQRLHSMEEFEGNGIGLASVARIIHRHGGEVWANSKVNQGATFFFTLDS